MRHGYMIPTGMFALRARTSDFEAAEREFGPIPRNRRVIRIGEYELHFFRVPNEDNQMWPTTGQFLKFNIQILASGSLITTEDNQ